MRGRRMYCPHHIRPPAVELTTWLSSTNLQRIPNLEPCNSSVTPSTTTHAHSTRDPLQAPGPPVPSAPTRTSSPNHPNYGLFHPPPPKTVTPRTPRPSPTE